MTSDQFFTEIVKLIDTFGSSAVISAAKAIETSRNKYSYVSRDRNAFRDFDDSNAASPKKYKDCWITQDYSNSNKGRICTRLRNQLRSRNIRE